MTVQNLHLQLVQYAQQRHAYQVETVSPLPNMKKVANSVCTFICMLSDL
jgi:hypothetical protein